MAAPKQCPHEHQTVTNGGPYYRQVHPNNFQDGRALSPAFVLQVRDQVTCSITSRHTVENGSVPQQNSASCKDCRPLPTVPNGPSVPV